ncbi:hypothetical protein [Subtercola lobariae]|uniref:Uncharacterized protein n=1 Tax=Subtercola lobariae TaxID=1588641 RepID=A0A917B8S5_9MICO|nr:hypothetical protein [Subtercola lobariae]GGF25823.1 hypothetical protein GCM10011399_19100 [Subtercola lobariae]
MTDEFSEELQHLRTRANIEIVITDEEKLSARYPNTTGYVDLDPVGVSNWPHAITAALRALSDDPESGLTVARTGLQQLPIDDEGKPDGIGWIGHKSRN